MPELFDTPMGLMILAGLGGIVLLAVALMLMGQSDKADPMQKFSDQIKPGREQPVADKARLRRELGREIKALDSFSRFLEPENEQELSAARQKMIQAGYYGKNAVRDMAALQFILAVGGLIVSFLLAFVIMPEAFEGTVALAAIMVAPMLIGYYGPKRWVERRATARQEEITAGFPDALDMMLICVEAGQSLDQAIQRIGREMKASYPALSEEFVTVGEQVRAGRERSEVLKDMAKRCDISDITSFATVMVQASTYGTSITDALRVFASEMRDKRIMRAEEKANLLPTKMTLGTMMFTVPPLLIILIGPSVVGIATELNPGVVGGM
ncbi:MAG: type II secretion system F family protein [Rhodobacteraceae bacterium]|nr:MAG: type II secretion system F family protein [Paracoccaceae bacterium]